MNDNEYLKLIGERIKHHRKLLHMSQEELANKCGYKTENARCMISRIEKGRINLPQSRMIALASALGVDATILFSDGIKNPSLLQDDFIEDYLKLSDAGKQYMQMQMDFAKQNFKEEEDAHIVPMLPVSIMDAFCDLRDSLGLHCRFHDLRHYSISLAHSLGIPDKVMMDKSGICNDSTFKKIYRNTIEADAKTYNDLLNEYFEQKIKADV